MQLRMTLAELGMSSIPSVLPVPRVQEAFTAEGEPNDPGFEMRASDLVAPPEASGMLESAVIRGL
jgi:hypothetical protein